MKLSKLLSISLTIATAIMTGCGGGGSSSSGGSGGTPPQTGTTISGTVMNGTNALQGASIQLYTVGTSGLQSASTALLSSAAITSATGTFSLTFSCGSATEVYFVASGGNSGAGSNSASSLISAVGPCSAISNSSSFIINETTTVASAFALAQYLADSAHLGASGTNPIGLTNAFTLVTSLVNPASGTVPGLALASGVTAPTATLDTLANILAGCIHSGSASSPACSTLFTTTSSSDTLGAALHIARQPASFLTLYSLASAYAPFSPALSAAPADWTLSLRVAATGLSTPYGVAIDTTGNAWLTNESATTLTELSPSGSLLNTIGSAGLIGPRGISIDRAGNIWVASTGNDSVVELTSTGSVKATLNSGVTGPLAVANDSAGNSWVVSSSGNAVVEISNTGSILNTITGFQSPSSIAVDASGNVWVANPGQNNILELSHAGALITTTGDGVTQAPAFVAIDSNANVWFTGSVPSTTAVQGSVAERYSTGVASAPILNANTLPFAIATAGSSVWIANSTSSGGLLQYQSGLSAFISPANGFGSLNTPQGVAVDPSGNVWTANSGDNSVSVFIGLATPVTTPLAANTGP